MWAAPHAGGFYIIEPPWEKHAVGYVGWSDTSGRLHAIDAFRATSKEEAGATMAALRQAAEAHRSIGTSRSSGRPG